MNPADVPARQCPGTSVLHRRPPSELTVLNEKPS
jgi:hypothetical protein